MNRRDLRLFDVGFDIVDSGLDGGDEEGHSFSGAGFSFDEQVALDRGALREVGEERENLGLDDGHVGVLEWVDGNCFECVGVYRLT
jgi:hypothetical protein